MLRDIDIFSNAYNPDGIERRLKDKIHGKPAREIIAEAQKLIGEQKQQVIMEAKYHDCEKSPHKSTRQEN